MNSQLTLFPVRGFIDLNFLSYFFAVAYSLFPCKHVTTRENSCNFYCSATNQMQDKPQKVILKPQQPKRFGLNDWT